MKEGQDTGAKWPAIILLVAAPLGFLASIPWLKNQSDFTVYISAAVAAIVVITAADALTRKRK